MNWVLCKTFIFMFTGRPLTHARSKCRYLYMYSLVGQGKGSSVRKKEDGEKVVSYIKRVKITCQTNRESEHV